MEIASYNADQLRFMRKAHEGLQQALHDLHTGQPLRLSVTDPVSAARERVAKAIDILAKAIQEG